MQERLQKILAKAGIASRRKAEEYIKQGRISVDHQVVTQMGLRVDPQKCVIAFDGKPISLEKKVYILLHKPIGYMCTLSDPQGRPLVSDLLPDVAARVFPVGRLDFDSEGALIMTNDGKFGHYLQHPKFVVNKTYKVIVSGTPSSRDLRRLEKGIMLEGRKTWPAKIRVSSRKPNETTLEVIIHEGRKRQVRKMFAAIGSPVKRLIRIAYGNLQLGGLSKGKFRYLSKKDIKKLFSGKIPFTISQITD